MDTTIMLFSKKGVLLVAFIFLIIAGVYGLAPFFYKQCENSIQDGIYLFLFNSAILWGIFLLGVVFVWIVWAHNFLFTERATITKIVSFLILGLLTISALFVYYLFVNPYAGIGGGVAHVASTPDRLNSYDIRNLQLTLEFYFDKFGKYPDSLRELTPEFLNELPEERRTGTSYEYGVSDNRDAYVLKTIVGVYEQTCRNEHYLSKYNFYTNRLNSDLDGEVFGVNCDDPAYCADSR